MNSQFDKPHNLNLPPPMPEGGPEPAPSLPEQAGRPRQETAPVTPERAPQATIVPPVAATPVALPRQQQQGSAVMDDVDRTTDVAVPALARNNDLIEKEWVARAKEIIEKTKDDPRLQSRDLTVFRADYMYKHYGRTLKLPE